MHQFNCAIVNHGNFRNHTHLHVKLRFSPRVFDSAVRKWTPEELQKVERIKAFAAKADKQRRQDGAQGKVEE